MSPSFMRGLLETKRDGNSAKPAGAIARATGSSPGAAYSSGLGPVGTWDVDYAVKNGLERVIWVFRCVDAIATNQAGLNILLRRGQDRRNGKVIADARLWKLLNFRANTYERSWQFRYRLSGNLLLARRGVFIEVINGEDGRPSELHLLPSGTTEPVPDPEKFVKEYRVKRSDYQIDTLQPEQVIWLRLKPHPTDPYAQMTPLMAAGIDVDTDWLARLFNRNFLANDGRPGMFITVDGGPGGLNPDDAEVIKSRFNGGPARAGQTTVVEAIGLNIQDLGTTPRDVQWGDLLSTSKERILLSFGVPESVMGNAAGRCLRQSEWVRLSDGTRRRARDLVGEDFELLTSTPDGTVPVPAWATWEKTETIYRVTTSHGRTLEVNGKHPLYASKSGGTPGWVATSDLTDEHFVAVPSVFPHEPSSDLSVDEAFVLGALIGDGSISSDRGHVALTTPEGEFADTFVTAVKNLGDVVTRREGRTVTEWHVKAKHDHLRDENGHCHCRTCLDRDAMNARNRRVGIGNKAVGRPVLLTGVKALIRKVGLSGTTSKTKFVPNEVFGATNEAQASFLGGLYAADGYILKNEIGLTLCNYELIKDVQELLLRLGVSSHLSPKRSVSTSLPQGGTYIGSYWHLSIADRNNILMFGKQVAVPGKQEKLDALVERKAASFTVSGWREKDLNPGLRWEHVRMVEKVGRDRTVGIAVPVEHTYLGTFWEHNTFDNADAERENFWMDTMVPHCDNIAASLDPLSGDIEDDTIFGYDYDAVDVLQRQAMRRREEWRTEFTAGVISLATYLERTGQKAIDHPAARAYFLPNGVAIPGKFEDEEAVKGLTILGGGTGVAPTDPSASAEAGARRGAAIGMRHLNNIVAARALQIGSKSQKKSVETKEMPGKEGSIGPAKTEYDKPHVYARDVQSGAGNCVCGAAVDDQIHPELAPGVPNPKVSTEVISGELVEKAHPYLGLRHRLEGGIEGVLTSWDMTQEKVVCERLMHVKSRRGTRHWDSEGNNVETKKLDPSYAVEVDRWVESLKSAVEVMVRKAIRAEVRGAATDLQSNGILDLLVSEGKTVRTSGSAVTILFGPRGGTVTDDIVNSVMDIVEKAARNQSGRLMKTIEEMDTDGASMKDIERAIRTSVGSRSTWRKSLATNVVTTAVEGARSVVYEKAGRYVNKQWNTVGDERVRDAHRAVDGVERKNGKAFRVGRSLLQYPGDPSGEPEDVINCRCFLEWRADFDELAK